ncbi:hypothetical protein SLS64_002832 [Diaporthe eres]|uniref:Uncharacterized protein n=1 Tax=Diaporthe eres TaxID=83184 RepID=A0ABR1PLK1_DIAER
MSQPEEHDEPHRIDRPADQLSTRVAHAVVELQGLSLDIDTFTKGKSDIVEVVSDDDENKKYPSPEPPVSSFDDSEGESQTSSEESWASFPSSGSNSTDSNSDAEEEEEKSAPRPEAGASLPSPEASFKFHEEFDGGGDDFDGTGGPEPPTGEEFTMENNDEEDAPYEIDMGPWSSRAIPKWAFLRSSNSLPVLGLGPEDFYHGGSALRHEVSAEDDDEGDEGLSEDGKRSRWSREIATVEVVYL